MSLNIHYEQEHNYLVAKIIGGLTADLLEKYGREINLVASKHNCKHLLNDFRDVNLKLSMMEVYDAPKILELTGIDKTWKRATVISNNLDNFKFFENVSRNRGYNIKIFTNMTKAIDWLILN